jgi:glycosyltransferase involved in cell wall biosynthesis
MYDDVEQQYNLRKGQTSIMLNMTIIFPVLNEEKRLTAGIERTVCFLEDKNIFNYTLLIVDNGSTDETEHIGKRLAEKYARVSYRKILERGVGAAFREGLTLTESEYVGYMDIDLSTDLQHLAEVARIFESDSAIEIINGSRLQKNSIIRGRKLSRKITSRALCFLLKMCLGMKITDAVCGFKFFRRTTAEQLVSASGNEKGWFYCAELLIRAEKRKISIVEIPVIWNDDRNNTTVKVSKLIPEYIMQIIILFIKLIILRRI